MSASFDRLRNKARENSATNAPETRGMWFNIRVMPDLATGELLNIGVGFVSSPDSRLGYRLLDRFDAFDCLYRKRLSRESLRFLIQTVRAAMPEHLPEGRLPLTPSPNIAYSDLKFIVGSSAEDILDDLYLETVTLAHVDPEREKTEERPDSLDTPTVRKHVFAAMFRLDPFGCHIIAERSEWEVSQSDEGGRPRVLDMPLRKPGLFGNVVSAWYRSQSLELHMLRASTDLDIAMKLHPEDQGGLFILRPPTGQSGFREEHQRKIDNIIDDLAWRMKVHKLRFEVEDHEERLARRVLDWAA